MILIKNYRGQLTVVLGALLGELGFDLKVLPYELLGRGSEKTLKWKCPWKRS